MQLLLAPLLVHAEFGPDTEYVATPYSYARCAFMVKRAASVPSAQPALSLKKAASSAKAVATLPATSAAGLSYVAAHTEDKSSIVIIRQRGLAR